MNLHSSSTGATVETVNPSELYEVLAAASSQDPSKLEASSRRIKQMFDMFGTYNALHEIAAQRNAPLQIRQQAIIQFKNAAISHWRARKVLSDEHKIQIRMRSLTFLDEEDETIATCNQVVVAKLARQDYPANWPSLFNDLMTAIDTTLQKRYQGGSDDPRDTLVLRRSLKLLNAILKELSSIKMLNGIKIMAQVTEQLQMVLYQYYSNLAPVISSSAITMQTIGTQRVLMDILFSHLVYKCTTKIAAWTWNRIDKVPKEEQQRNKLWLEELFKSSIGQVKALTDLRTSITTTFSQNNMTPELTAQRAIDLLYRHIRAFGKWFRRLQQLSPTRFTALPTSDDLILFYWTQVVQATSGPPHLIRDSNDAVFPTRFLVQGMVLFKENLSNWVPVRRDGSENPHSLSKEFVENAVQILIERFMPLNPKDLESWMADPEEWVNMEDKENDLWEYEIRPCSERVLMQLANQYSQYVTPFLDATFKQIATQPSLDLASVIRKEALYCAIGRCAHKMKDVIPFDQWLEHTLSSEARDTNPNYPIIKRRIAWMIGKWVSEECASPKNPRVWDILLHLLTNKVAGTDNVVRFTAARALKDCVDTIEFDANIFQPYLPPILKELMDLIEEADTFESKQRIGQSLVTVIEQCGDKVVPLMNIVAEPLPKLWIAAGEEWLFKVTLVVTLDKLILVTKEHSTPLVSLVAPLVREGLSPAARTFLDEDVLGLWQTALRNTTSIAGLAGASLAELFPIGMELLSENPDMVPRVTTILDSYYFLDAPGVLQVYSSNLLHAYFNAIKGKTMHLVQKDLLVSLQYIVQLAPPNLWGEALHTSGLFAWLLSIFLEGENVIVILIEAECLFARIIMADPDMFCRLISASVPALKMEEEKIYDLFMDQWWGRFDALSEPRQRKLIALATASLVATCHPNILNRLPGEVFNLWLDVFGELREAETRPTENDEDGYSPGLKRHWDLNEAPDDYLEDAQGTCELARRQALYEKDPVRNARMTTFIAHHLRQTEARIGPQLFQANYLSKADPTVLKQIQDELARP